MKLCLALASGVLLALLFPRFNIVYLAPLALAPLLLAAARQESPWRRFLYGEAAGIVYWLGVCYWIHFVLIAHGDMSWPPATLAFVIFLVAKSLHMAVFALLAGPLMRYWYAVPAVAALWTGIERTHGPLGFAWLCLGNAGAGMGVPMRLAPFTGVYGLSFVFAMMSATVALLLLRRPRAHLAWLLLLPPLYLLPSLPDAVVGAESLVSLQPNVAERDNWTGAEAAHLHDRMIYASLEAALDKKQPPPRLIVWPEVPAPLYYTSDLDFQQKANQLPRLTGTPFLFGTVTYSKRLNPLNSAQLLSAAGEMLTRYDKMFLVPFGEFVPPLFGWVNRISNESGDFEPGSRLVVSTIGGRKVGTFICYESVFPHLVRRFAAEGAEVFVNLTNDGYFGDSNARPQHLLIARMRAAENRRWLLRSTNDGITAAIDPAGRVMERWPEHKFMAARLRYSHVSSQTVYTRYGDWFAWSCLAGALLLSGWIALRRRGSNRSAPDQGPET